MEYPITVRTREVLIVEGKPAEKVVELPSPDDIMPEVYAKQLIHELDELPQAWVYIVGRVLGRATPKEIVQWREGPSKMQLCYVDGAYAIATRAALTRIGVGSDLEVLQTDASSEAVEALVKVTFKFFHNNMWSTISSTQWGECWRRAGMALGDVKKGAVTDGLKKCLSEFGWAADVYNASPVFSPPPDPEQMRLQSIETLYSVGSGRGLTQPEMDAYISKLMDGKTAEQLEPKDITSLKRKLQKMSDEEVKEVAKNAETASN